MKSIKHIAKHKNDLEDLIQSLQRNDLKSFITCRIKGVSRHDGVSYRPGIDPEAYAISLLPFIDTSHSFNELCAQVDPFHVIGSKYRRLSSGGLSESEVMDTLNEKTIETHTTNGGDPEAAYYYKIGTLPMYYAGEGKNRVSLFQKHNRTIAAIVKTLSFPEANKLTVVRYWPYRIYGLMYSGLEQVLPFPEVSLPIIEEYGVTRRKQKIDFLAPFKLRQKIRYVTSRQNWS
jgi:hypothetical protein